jgi:hypothetical protein
LITPPSFWRASAQWPVCSGSSRRLWIRRMSGPTPRKAWWPSFPRHLEKEFARCPSTPPLRTKTCTAMCMRSPARFCFDLFGFRFAFSLLACVAYCFVDGALRCLRACYPMSVQGICRRYVRSVLLVVQRQSENNCRCGNLVSLGARSQLACSPSAWDLYFCYEADWLREVKALLTVGAQSEVNVNVESVVSCRHLGYMLTTRNVRIICVEINFR